MYLHLEIEFIKKDSEKTLASMETGTKRIRDIVLSLRNFSRVDEAEHKSVDLHEGIENTLLLLQYRLKKRPNRSAIQVVRSYGDLPPVQCYAGQLNQVIMHIVSNAIDALEEKVEHYPNVPIDLQIQVCTAVHQHYLKISISDNGLGMTPEVKRRLFDPFFTTKEVGKGTGMGMAISYQLITENHNGIIKCFSNQGIGTTIVIKLPTDG
ncbi:MAG: ATP-binding protein [Cyanobacteria bacterium J06642_11]